MARVLQGLVNRNAIKMATVSLVLRYPHPLHLCLVRSALAHDEAYQQDGHCKKSMILAVKTMTVNWEIKRYRHSKRVL